MQTIRIQFKRNEKRISHEIEKRTIRKYINLIETLKPSILQMREKKTIFAHKQYW